MLFVGGYRAFFSFVAHAAAVSGPCCVSAWYLSASGSPTVMSSSSLGIQAPGHFTLRSRSASWYFHSFSSSTHGMFPRPSSSRNVQVVLPENPGKKFTTRAAPNKNASSHVLVSSSCPFLVFCLVSSSAWCSAKQKVGLAANLAPRSTRCVQPCCGISASPLRAFQRALSQQASLRVAEICGHPMLRCLSAPNTASAPPGVRTENCVAWFCDDVLMRDTASLVGWVVVVCCCCVLLLVVCALLFVVCCVWVLCVCVCCVLCVVCCVLCVVCCVLLVVCCWLLVVGCWLLVVGCWLLVVGCWLCVVVGCLL